MPMRWWTTHTGYDWSPDLGYNDLFKEYVRDIRNHFHLSKTNRRGVQVNEKGLWVPYDVQNEDTMVIVDSFNWNGYDSFSENVYFMLKVRVGIKRRSLFEKFLGMEGGRLKIIFDERVRVNFPPNFPSSPPLFNIQNRDYHVDDQHNHHLYSDGTLCILAGSSDWDPDVDKVLRAIHAMVDWTVWHYKNWGSNPRRW